MGLALAESDGALVEEAADAALARAERAGALAIGPGLGRAVAAQRLVKDLVRRSPRPFVLDADGLFAFAGWAADLADRSAPGVLTPHAGELGRLLDCSSDEVGARRLHRCVERHRPPAASLCSRATTRSSPHPTVRSR